ncbi:hypothetical protein RN001_003605, partial [Aquatica leii]
MSELTPNLVKDKVCNANAELNNNNSDLTISNQRILQCVSSASSSNSDMSDVDAAFLEGDETTSSQQGLNNDVAK